MAITGKSTSWGDMRGGGKGPRKGPRFKVEGKDRPKLKPSDKGFGNG